MGVRPICDTQPYGSGRRQLYHIHYPNMLFQPNMTIVPYDVRDNKARYPEAPPWPTLAYNAEITNIPQI